MNTKVIILIVVGVLVVIGGNVALTVFLLGNNEPAQPAVVAGDSPAAPAAAAAPEQPAEPVYVRIDAFTVTFDDPNSARFLQIEAYVIVGSDEEERLIERHMPAMRSELVMLFASQTAEALSTASGKERLRMEALDAVREVFTERAGRPLATDFLFTKFVMQ